MAALIEKEGKYLIAKRLYGNEETQGKWEFPGGKLEVNEKEEDAVEREIREEFEMNVKAVKFVTNNVFTYSDKTIDLRLYECKYVSGEFHLHDHSEYKYVDKNEIINYDLCPADKPLAMFVQKM